MKGLSLRFYIQKYFKDDIVKSKCRGATNNKKLFISIKVDILWITIRWLLASKFFLSMWYFKKQMYSYKLMSES